MWIGRVGRGGAGRLLLQRLFMRSVLFLLRVFERPWEHIDSWTPFRFSHSLFRVWQKITVAVVCGLALCKSALFQGVATHAVAIGPGNLVDIGQFVISLIFFSGTEINCEWFDYFAAWKNITDTCMKNKFNLKISCGISCPSWPVSALQMVRFPTVSNFFQTEFTWQWPHSNQHKKYYRLVFYKKISATKIHRIFQVKPVSIFTAVGSNLRRFQLFFLNRMLLTVTPFYSAWNFIHSSAFEKYFIAEIAVQSAV